MTETTNTHRIEAPAPITTPADELVEFPAKLDVESAEWISPTSKSLWLTCTHADIDGAPVYYSLVMTGRQPITVYDDEADRERIEQGWLIHPVARGRIQRKQQIGWARFPAGLPTEEWLNCWDVFTIEAIEAIERHLTTPYPLLPAALPLDIESVRISGRTGDHPMAPPTITLFCGEQLLLMVGAHKISVSDEREEVEGWGIYPVSRSLDILWDHMIGSALPPEGGSADAWLDCADVFTAEAIEVLHEHLRATAPA